MAAPTPLRFHSIGYWSEIGKPFQIPTPRIRLVPETKNASQLREVELTEDELVKLIEDAAAALGRINRVKRDLRRLQRDRDADNS